MFDSKHPVIRLMVLLVALFALFLLSSISVFGEAIHAQPQATPTATPNPTVSALQAQVVTQATKVAILEDTVQLQIDKLEFEITKKYLQWTIVFGVLASLGIPLSIGATLKYARDKAKEAIDKAIYYVDPSNAVVHIPKDGFDREKDYLKLFGFHKFRTFAYIDNTCLRDCVVVVPQNKQDIDDFRTFLRKHKPELSQVAYLIYTIHLTERVPPNIVDDFANITFANSLVTLGTNMFTIARSLID